MSTTLGGGWRGGRTSKGTGTAAPPQATGDVPDKPAPNARGTRLNAAFGSPAGNVVRLGSRRSPQRQQPSVQAAAFSPPTEVPLRDDEYDVLLRNSPSRSPSHHTQGGRSQGNGDADGRSGAQRRPVTAAELQSAVLAALLPRSHGGATGTRTHGVASPLAVDESDEKKAVTTAEPMQSRKTQAQAQARPAPGPVARQQSNSRPHRVRRQTGGRTGGPTVSVAAPSTHAPRRGPAPDAHTNSASVDARWAHSTDGGARAGAEPVNSVLPGAMVTVQLGQCGNQVGGLFFDALSSYAANACAHDSTQQREVASRFFRYSHAQALDDTHAQAHVPLARAVLVDMEPKVIHNVMSTARRTGRWQYSSKRQCWRHSGSANNWAYGYGVHGPQTADDVSEVIRREVEHCDMFSGFLLLQSLAGGTGSGLGTCVTEYLRDEYAHKALLNQVVWPHEQGEVIVQSYNSLLSLSHLDVASDGLLVVENDHLATICTKLLNVARPKFSDLNGVLAGGLASLMLPSYSESLSTRQSLCPLLDGMGHLCAHPGYKITTLRTIPQVPVRSKHFSSDTWYYILRHLRQMGIADAFMQEGVDWRVSVDQPKSVCRSVASAVCLRGRGADDAARAVRRGLPVAGQGKDMPTLDFYASSMYADWSLDPLLVSSNNTVHQSPLSAALWATSQSIVRPLDRVVDKAFSMYTSKAYLHHYLNAGLEQDEFDHAFMHLEQVLYNYRNM